MKKGSVIRLLAVFVLAMACLFAAACTTEKAKFKVTFDSDGGSAVQEQTIEKGGFALEPDAPTKAGYTFTGWTLDGEKFTFSETPVNDNITLKAAWTANTDTKYYVTVKVDGEDKTADYAEAFELASADGKYYLTGTTDTQADITAVAEANKGDSLSVADTSKLTGNIAGDESLALIVEYKTNEYTVSFDTGSETPIAAQTVEHGDTATDPNFTKAGYAVKWQKDGEDFSFDTPITANTELTLVLTPNTDTKYYVTVKVDGEDKTADYAEAFELASADGKYYLTGTTDTQADISADASAQKPEGYHVEDTSKLTGNIAGDESLALIVEYAVNTYTILFNAGGGSGTMQKMVLSYGETAELTANAFTKLNYTFAGWKCGELSYTDGQEITNLSAEDGDELEFVAQWTLDDLLIAKSDEVVVPFTPPKGSDNNNAAHRFKVGKTGSGADNISSVLDALTESSVLSMDVKVHVTNDAWAVIDDFTLRFYALGGTSVIQSFVSGYMGDNGKTLSNDQTPRLTLSAEATDKIRAAGGFEVCLYTPSHNAWRSDQIQVSALAVNKYLPEVELGNDLSDVSSYTYGYAGDKPNYYAYEESSNYGTSVLNLQGAKTSNNTFFEIEMDTVRLLRSGDTLSLDIYFYSDPDDLYDYNWGTYQDYAFEIYALSETNDYTTPLFSFGAQEYKLIPWRWITLEVPADKAQEIAAAGGFAVRLRMPAGRENLSYQLYVDNIAINFGEETVAIETSAETYEADIAAEVAARFDGYCAAWVQKITEQEGNYNAEIVLSKDGYFDRVINIQYTPIVQE